MAEVTKDLFNNETANNEVPDTNRNIQKQVKFINICREQKVFDSFFIDNLIPDDHEARAIVEFIDMIDISSFIIKYKTVEGKSGRKALHPKILLSLWLYALSKGISSGREIAQLLEYNPAFQWIAGMELINYHTLSTFRTDNDKALNELFIKVLSVLTKEGLVTLERIMHDGTKIKANASGDTYRRKDTLERHIEMAKEQLTLLKEGNDDQISLKMKAARQRAINEKNERLKLASEEYKKIEDKKKTKEEKQEARVSLTDPESRIMKQSNGGYGPSYNAQISADSKSNIIVGVAVTQEGTDSHQLLNAVERIEKNTDKKIKQMVGDGGYTNRENIIAMSNKQIDFVGSISDESNKCQMQMERRGVKKAFFPDKFKYYEEENKYMCPKGKELKYEGKEMNAGKINYKYRCKKQECDNCENKKDCCNSSKKGRCLIRSEEAKEVLDFRIKMETEEYKNIYKKRSEIIEFVNAWIKEKMKLRQFRLRGLEKTNIELLWHCIAYNINQWIRLIWRKPQSVSI